MHVKCVLLLNSSLTQLHVIFYCNTIGIHVVHVNLDGIVRAPETSFKLLSRGNEEGFQKFVRDRICTENILEPESIADTYFHLHMQPKGTWTQDLDLRPWKTNAWWMSK